MSGSPVRLVSIAVHPVKSTAVRPVREAEVEPWGLAGDRRWMVVGPDGECLTARAHPRLFAVTTDTRESDAGLGSGLRLASPGLPDLRVEEPVGEMVPVTVHGRGLAAVVAPGAAGEWVDRAIGLERTRLVHVARPRPLNPEHSLPGDATAFADAYPVTLASASSLRRLDEWVTESALESGEEPAALEVSRFRPNLVVDGDLEPFEEDHWRRVRVGGVSFRVAKPVDRCVMTTIDPHTCERGHEPIRTLARHRKWDGATWFAVQLVPDVPGRIAVGDQVSPQR